MTVVETLKSAVSRPALNSTTALKTVDQIKTDQDDRPLQNALRSVERHFEMSDAVKEKAEVEYIDEQLMSNLDAEVFGELEIADETVELLNADDEANSARILELQAKQEACKDIHATIVQGTNLLRGLADRANQLTAYLEKTEIEIEHLEHVEANSSKLKSAATNLTSKYHEMKATIEEQRQQIGLLEAHRASSRDSIEKGRIEISSLLEKQEVFEAEIAAHKSTRVRLDNDKVLLQEKIELLERSNADLQTKTEEQLKEIQELTGANQRKEMDLSKSKSKLIEMDQAIERHQIDLADIRSKNESVSASFIDTKTKLDESLFLVESIRREFDEKMNRKEKKVAELEVQNQVLTRQNALNEDIIAEMDHQFSADSVAKAQEQSDEKVSKDVEPA